MAIPEDHVPDTLSKQQLVDLFKTAQKDLLSCPLPRGQIDEEELVASWFSAWFDQSKELYRYLNKHSKLLADSRTVDQLMALGTFRALLGMSMSALNTAEGHRFDD